MINMPEFPEDDLLWIQRIAATIVPPDASERVRNSIIDGVRWGLHIHWKVLADLESVPRDQVGSARLGQALHHFTWDKNEQPDWVPVDETGRVDLVALGAATIAIVRAFQENPHAQWICQL